MPVWIALLCSSEAHGLGRRSDVDIQLIRERIQIIDFHGRTVIPGPIDAHKRSGSIGLMETACIYINPPAVRTVTAIQAITAEGVAQMPAGE